VAATIAATGPESKQTTADAGGLYTMVLKPGNYTLSATADRYLRKEAILQIAGGPQPVTADFSLSLKPKRSLVKITKKELVIAKQVHFGTNNAQILPDSQQLLDSLVDVLVSNPNIKKVEVGGHTDNRGKIEANQQLSQARADAVKDYLVKNGVAADRLDAKGYGPGKPKGPNLTAAGRARNRRVEFLILEQ
jgi:outer membrane protein OmpA-like peptidoglycan-associated protein